MKDVKYLSAFHEVFDPQKGVVKGHRKWNTITPINPPGHRRNMVQFWTKSGSMRTPKKRRPPNRKRRPADGDFPPLDDIDFGLVSEAWTQSLVIDFWRSATFRLHTRATLQEYDLVMKKCQGENINIGLDSEAWTQSLVIDFWRSATFRQHTRATLQEYDLVMKKCQEENTKFKLDYLLIEILPTYNYTQLLPQRRL